MDIKSVDLKLRDFAKSLVGNRALDVYLKYMGIKLLNTATLVPVALILGKDYFESFIKDMKQTGGGNFPVIDDPLIGNSLKLAGASALTFTPETLVPLGILMLVYDLINKNQIQKGGNLNNFVKETYGNRVLDLFLKYQGLKLLTSTTLVPFALIFGKDILEDFFKGDKEVMTGGGIIPKDLPILDDPLLGNWLKLSGLTVLDISLGTLIPLGIIATLYDLYFDK